MGHSKKEDVVVSEDNVDGSTIIEDQNEYAKIVLQLQHAKNQRAKEQRKVTELEQNVSILIQVKIINYVIINLHVQTYMWLLNIKAI